MVVGKFKRIVYNNSKGERGNAPMKGKIFNIQKFSINDGEGIRTTVFFKGCPLRCKWCANPESQNRYMAISDAMENPLYSGREYTAQQVMDVVLQDKLFYEESHGGMTLSGGEPLQQADFAMELADLAHQNGIHVAAETTGFAPPAVFQRFMAHVDLFLMDVKHFDREAHKEGTGVYNDLILENLATLAASGRPVIARIPVIPHFNTGLKTAAGLADLLARVGVREVHLLPFHQLGENKYAQLQVEYQMAGFKQLPPEALGRYRQVFLDRGLHCSIR